MQFEARLSNRKHLPFDEFNPIQANTLLDRFADSLEDQELFFSYNANRLHDSDSLGTVKSCIKNVAHSMHSIDLEDEATTDLMGPVVRDLRAVSATLKKEKDIALTRRALAKSALDTSFIFSWPEMIDQLPDFGFSDFLKLDESEQNYFNNLAKIVFGQFDFNPLNKSTVEGLIIQVDEDKLYDDFEFTEMFIKQSVNIGHMPSATDLATNALNIIYDTNDQNTIDELVQLIALHQPQVVDDLNKRYLAVVELAEPTVDDWLELVARFAIYHQVSCVQWSSDVASLILQPAGEPELG